MITRLSAVNGLNLNGAVKFHSGSHIQKENISKTESSKFDELLRDRIESADVKFSAHAIERLKHRNIELGKDDVLKLNEAVEKAQAKGSRESLILLNDLALIVSVKNRMVITAFDNGNVKENVFTNIDSAVILKD